MQRSNEMDKDSLDRRLLLAGAGIAGVAALSRLAAAGPIDPPPGPVAPTGRTLQELHDRIARGAQGFGEARIPIQSLPPSPTATHSITQRGSYYLSDNIIGEAGKHAIEIASDGVAIDLNGYTINFAGVDGINTGGYADAVVQNGAVRFSGRHGVAGGQIIDRILCLNNQALGFTQGRAYTNCAARGNGDHGFLFVGGLAVDCVAGDNVNVGFFASYGCLLRRCSASGNDSGFIVELQTAAEECIARDNRAFGFLVRYGSSATRCHAHSNPNTGFTMGTSHVDECQARQNGTGFAAGLNERALITRCSASGNTANYNIQPGNAYGPLLNVAGIGDLGGFAGAAHPWANFAH